jgi:hypothetical protein
LEKFGRSWKKLEEVGKIWKKLEEVGKIWKNLESYEVALTVNARSVFGGSKNLDKTKRHNPHDDCRRHRRVEFCHI